MVRLLGKLRSTAFLRGWKARRAVADKVAEADRVAVAAARVGSRSKPEG